MKWPEKAIRIYVGNMADALYEEINGYIIIDWKTICGSSFPAAISLEFELFACCVKLTTWKDKKRSKFTQEKDDNVNQSDPLKLI